MHTFYSRICLLGVPDDLGKNDPCSPWMVGHMASLDDYQILKIKAIKEIKYNVHLSSMTAII